MFEKIYLAVDSKVMIDEKIVEKTKEKMKIEIENTKSQKNINFYKCVTLAACIVLFIGVIGIYPKNIGSDNLSEGMNNNLIIQDAVTIPNNNFNSIASIESFDKGVDIEAVEKDSIVDSIQEFIADIIQWFKELLF